MNDNKLTKEKFILQLITVLTAGVIVFCSFVAIDRYHERHVKLKLAELGFEYNKEYLYERKPNN